MTELVYEQLLAVPWSWPFRPPGVQARNCLLVSLAPTCNVDAACSRAGGIHGAEGARQHNITSARRGKGRKGRRAASSELHSSMAPGINNMHCTLSLHPKPLPCMVCLLISNPWLKCGLT